jgi:hypothetical protein
LCAFEIVESKQHSISSTTELKLQAFLPRLASPP